MYLLGPQSDRNRVPSEKPELMAQSHPLNSVCGHQSPSFMCSLGEYVLMSSYSVTPKDLSFQNKCSSKEENQKVTTLGLITHH